MRRAELVIVARGGLQPIEVGGDASLFEFERALCKELGVNGGDRLAIPGRARGWRAFLSLALIALHAEETRNLLISAWGCSSEIIDVELEPYRAMGWVQGLDSASPAPSLRGYAAIARYLIEVGHLTTTQ